MQKRARQTETIENEEAETHTHTQAEPHVKERLQTCTHGQRSKTIQTNKQTTNDSTNAAPREASKQSNQVDKQIHGHANTQTCTQHTYTPTHTHTHTHTRAHTQTRTHAHRQTVPPQTCEDIRIRVHTLGYMHTIGSRHKGAELLVCWTHDRGVLPDPTNSDSPK